MRRFRELLMKDIGWKLLSVAIAAVMWFMVINITHPVDTRGYSRPLVLENADTLTERGLTLANGEELRNMKISVKVKAQRTALDRLNQSTDWIKASLDLSVLENAANGDTVSVPVDVVMTGGGTGYDIVNKSPLMVEAVVETLAAKEFPVTIILDGQPEDVHLSEPHLSNESVTVRGPVSLVNRVKEVRGYVSAGDVQKSEVQRVRLNAYGADGEAVRGVTTGVSEVTVSYTLYDSKHVPVQVDITGTPAAGYKVGEITSSPRSIEVVGTEEALKDFVVIQMAGIDISGRSQTLTRNYKLADYLPQGVQTGEGTPENIRITVEIGQQASREVTLGREQLSLLGQEEALEYQLADSVTLTVSGEQDVLDALQPETLRASVNVAGLSAGTHTAIVHAELPEGLAAGLAYINVTVTDTASEEPPAPEEPVETE